VRFMTFKQTIDSTTRHGRVEPAVLVDNESAWDN